MRDEYPPALQQLCVERGIAMLPWFGLAAGFLTGKYRRNSVPGSARAEAIQKRYFNDRGFAILDMLDEVASDHSATVAQVALAWLLAQPVITAPIIGANSVEQLNELLKAVEIKLPPENIDALNKASAWE
jgi:aryl-alcohol dehydrogenase-like predicted oxidoreductase